MPHIIVYCLTTRWPGVQTPPLTKPSHVTSYIIHGCENVLDRDSGLKGSCIFTAYQAERIRRPFGGSQHDIQSPLCQHGKNYCLHFSTRGGLPCFGDGIPSSVRI